MLGHFFGYYDFSGSEYCCKEIKEGILREVGQIGGFFQMESGNQHRSLLVSNVFVLERKISRVGISLCGDLVAKDSEKTLIELASGEIDFSGEVIKSMLKGANGTFAFAALADELWLATDFLGGRPLFHAVHEGVLIFGTSFELIRRLIPKPCSLDFQAASEDFCFGYPLSDRTLANEIKVLRGGEYIRCSRGEFEVAYYERFPVELETFTAIESSLEASALAIRAAIHDRVQSGESQVALLSGGLDSRVIVSELLEEGHQVTAANYSLVGTLDRIFAEQFSESSRISLRINNFQKQYHCLAQGETTSFSLNAAQSGLPEKRIFSGDGGGEIFGFIDIKPEFFQCSCFDDFVNLMIHQQPSKYIGGDKFRDNIIDACRDGLRSQLDHIGFRDELKAAYVLYLVNDLRRHLHEYFSGLCSETRELLLPYYDRRVIGAALRIPNISKELVGHGYYYRLLDHLSPAIKLVPWQSYPGSIPCPVPYEEGRGVSQWGYERETNRRDARRWAFLALRSINLSVQNKEIRAVILVVLCCFAIIGLYKNSYIFKQILRVNRYFSLARRK
ncbi:hypothetical protein AB6Q56_08185 [Dechloromonas sp. ARDL1]|uniref:hypothetical protein n=1 Tax=Dechloromonas sp. ARDL1 TaxID=3322121 RepID=UPI003DA6FB67